MLAIWLAGCTFVTDQEWTKRLEACDQGGLYIDGDGDGWGGEAASGCKRDDAWVDHGGDCDDADTTVHPGGLDEPYDGTDADCGGGDDYDADGDGHASAAHGGDDCFDSADDAVPVLADDCGERTSTPEPVDVHPGAADEAYDGIDSDCSGGSDFDADGDGYSRCTECNDADAAVYPNDGAEVWYNGVDENCDGNDGDQDADGYVAADYPYEVPEDLFPGDCWDDPNSIPAAYTALNGLPQVAAVDAHPKAADAFYDGVDAACDAGNDFDADADTHASDAWPNAAGGLGDDCDDEDGSAYPGAPESWYDGVDSDCSGGSDDDQDEDGYDALDEGGTDCDDIDAYVSPAAVEDCTTAVDENCDGEIDSIDAIGCTAYYLDDDADGYGSAAAQCRCEAAGAYSAATSDDCDDAHSDANPGVASEVCTTDYDDDCDGSTNAVDVSGCTTWYYDADADGYGTEAASCTCVASGTYTASLTGDCDDADASILLTRTFYEDADADGYGNASVSATACVSLTGYVTNAADCEDTRSDAHPGATETCASWYDDDCDGDTNDLGADACTAFYLDADADGYGTTDSACTCSAAGSYTASNTSDCDDAYADAHPGGTETCATTYDDDCNGTSNEIAAPACSTWFVDTDGDDYGSGPGQCQCSAGFGYEGVSPGDCDDADAARFPTATEACDGVDNDCNDIVDDGATTEFYEDGDGDGYGDPSSSTIACSAPSGYVVSGTDCDDGSATISPAAAEDCSTGFDDNCDATTNSAGAVGCTAYYEDADGDGYGTTSTSCLCTAVSPYTASSTSDCDDAASTVNPGQSEICGDGLDNNCDESPNSCTISGTSVVTTWARATFIGEVASDNAGAAVADAGDFDGDGLHDALIGAYYNDSGASNAGAAYIAAGMPTGATDLSAVTLKITGAAANDYFGRAVSGAGDVDGDGDDDVIVGAYLNDGGATDAGAAYVIGGGSTGTLSASSATAIFEGDGANDYAARSVTGGGDFDDDGYAEVALGASQEDSGGVDAGTAYVFYGPASGSFSVSSADARLTGEDIYDYAGYAVAVAGDVNGDGMDDLLVGAYGADDGGASAGAAYLLLGPISGTTDLSLADARYLGEDAGDQAGSAVAGGDMDGDGLADVMIGAPEVNDNGAYAGAVYVVLGLVSGDLDLAAADGKLRGNSGSDHAGLSVSIGDLDADGIGDPITGAWGDDTAASTAGAAYVLYGPPAGTAELSSVDVIFTGATSSDFAGYSVAGVADYNGDAYDDVLVGAYGQDSGGSSAGSAYLVLGGGF